MAQRVWTVGVDLGGTKIHVAQVDAYGTILKKVRLPTHPESSPSEIIAAMIASILELNDAAGSQPVAVGVGVAGQIEPKTGLVYYAPNLGWRNVSLQDDLNRGLHLPVIVVNDVRAATLGEWRFGAGKGCDDLLCLFLGTGIGGGIVSGGHLLTGASNSAGELGHLTVDFDGPMCRCGNQGCLEALAGGWSLGNRAQQLAQKDPIAGKALLELTAGKIEAIDAKIIVEAAHRGDPLAKTILAQAGQAVIAGCVGLANAFNPARFVIGGGLVDGLPHVITLVQKGIAQRALPSARSAVQVLSAQLANDAGVIGAAALALETFK